MTKKITYFFNWMTSLGGYANVKVTRFLRYTVVGGNTFLLDLILLWTLIELFSIHYLVAAAISYIASTIVHYIIVRSWAFRGTERKAFTGYILYSLILGSGLLINTGLMALAVEIFTLNIFIARILAGVLVGLWNYLLNLFVNFKTHDKPL